MSKTESYWEEYICKDPQRYNTFVSCLERISSRRKVFEMVIDKGYKRVLDAGCGVGFEYSLYKKHPVKYFGLDITKGFLFDLKKREPEVRLCNAKIQELPLKINALTW